LHAALIATTDTEGRFIIKEIPPGRYTVAYAEAKNRAAVSFEDGFTITMPFAILGEGGSTTNSELGLSLEFRDEHLLNFEVRVGETTEIEITAWEL